MVQVVRPVEEDIERQLDQLIPPPLSRPSKLLVGSLLLLLAGVIAYLNLGGYIVPQPFNGISFGSSSQMALDESRGLVSATVLIPNNSDRTLRVTSVTLDAPGAELVDVQILREGEHVGRDPDSGQLPVVLRPGDGARLVLWVRPLSCKDVAPPWGVASATFDFGDGAFPPFASTIRIEDDPIWEEGDQPAVRIADEFLQGTGPLSLFCEVLR
ncbi:MAG: hypothetical protein GY926_10095 [bacterium]|nr:hypothetical protein [bacterium]